MPLCLVMASWQCCSSTPYSAYAKQESAIRCMELVHQLPAHMQSLDDMALRDVTSASLPDKMLVLHSIWTKVLVVLMLHPWLQVYGLPTLVVFKDGKVLDGSQREGAISEPELRKYLDKWEVM